jgi:hypothetical protein
MTARAAGDHAAAIATTLERFFADPAGWRVEGLLPDPRLDPIRDDTGFQALVEKYGRP